MSAPPGDRRDSEGSRSASGGGSVRPRRRWRLVRASSDAIPDSLRRLMSRARPARLADLPWKLIAATTALVVFVGWVVWISPVLGVRQVQVAGVIRLTEDEVRVAAAINLGVPLARVDVDGVRDRVGRLAMTESVAVTRKWPSTLHIEVLERTPLVAVKRDNMYHVFDRHAVAFLAQSSLPADVLEVRFADSMPGDRAVRAAITVAQSLTEQLRSEMVRLVVNSPAGIQLELTKDRVVIWGDAENSDLKAKVATALLTQKGKRFDVSVPEIVTIQ